MPRNTAPSRRKSISSKFNFRRTHLAIFVVAFALIGGLGVWRSLATASLVASLEAEQMALPSGASMITDSTASGGQAVKMSTTGTKLAGTVTLPSNVTSINVIARGTKCQSGWPRLNLRVDGTSVIATAVKSSSWRTYTANVNLTAATHNVTINYSTTNSCGRYLYVDVTNFFGPQIPPPAPTVTISASPSSVIAGQAATLTWASTNADQGCVASDAWSGAEPTSGTQSTGALNQTSTYTLTCTGAGGSASGSAIVTVTQPSGDPQPTGVPGTWTLSFDDEFDGTAIDTNKWSPCWFYPTCGTQNNVSTSPANVKVANGNLVLTLASSSSGASVETNPKGGAKVGYQFQYGVAEARIWFPGDSTHCYNWPAWWTDGQSWPANGENDIAEVLGGQMTVNYHSSSGSHNQGAVPGYWCGGYHTYTLNRQVGHANVYYDGTLVKSYSTDDGGALQYLIINVGSSSYPAYGAASQVKVDYVRAWQ
jgi:hypothetical protein